MATRAAVPPAPRRTLVAGVGALLILFALTAAWVVLGSDRGRDPVGTERFVVGTVTVEREGATITLLGSVPSVDAGRTLVDSLAERSDVTVVVNRLVPDEAAPMPVLGPFHTGLDALRAVPG